MKRSLAVGGSDVAPGSPECLNQLRGVDMVHCSMRMPAPKSVDGYRILISSLCTELLRQDERLRSFAFRWYKPIPTNIPLPVEKELFAAIHEYLGDEGSGMIVFFVNIYRSNNPLSGKVFAASVTFVKKTTGGAHGPHSVYPTQ